jgi:hypothetical protein
LERRFLTLPNKLRKIRASLVDCLLDITPDSHQVAEKCDQIQECRFPARIWPDQRLEPIEPLIDKLETSKMKRLKPCEHLDHSF